VQTGEAQPTQERASASFHPATLAIDIPGQENNQAQLDDLGGLDSRQGAQLQGQPCAGLIHLAEQGSQDG
jgi:hypothetical protein